MLHNEQFIPLSETNFASKRRRLQENFNETRQMLFEQAEQRKAEAEERMDYERSRLAEGFGISSNKRESKRKLQEQLERNYKVMEHLLTESMVEIFMESLVLDTDFIDKAKENLETVAREFFTESFNQGLFGMESFSKSTSSTMKEIYGICEDAIVKINEDALSKSDVKVYLQEAQEERKSAVNHVADSVKDKVTKVIKREKEISEQNQKDLEDAKAQEHVVMRRQDPSLFRNMIISNSKKVLSESAGEGGVNMDMVMAESVVQYTLLEALNTTGLYKFSPKQAQSLSFTIGWKK
jgi:hypothetical protein